MKFTHCFSFLILFLHSEMKVYASPNMEASHVPLVITGKEMQYDAKQNESQVIGDAFAKWTLSSPSSSVLKYRILRAESLSVCFYSNNQNTTTSQNLKNVKSIKAQGKVIFKEDDLTIEADYCIYQNGGSSQITRGANKIFCTKNVILRKGDHTLMGEKAEANLRYGTYKVSTINSSNKVNATISPSISHIKK